MLQNKRVSLTDMIFNKRHLHQLNKRSHIDDEIYDRWHTNHPKTPHHRNRHEHLNESFVDLDETPTNEDETNMSLTQSDQKNIKFKIDTPNECRQYFWLGKDYCNTYREDIKECHEHAKDQFDRAEVPRMPWRDQGMVMVGESARDLARHFIQRWNYCKVVGKKLTF
jgi:hypothetical protein